MELLALWTATFDQPPTALRSSRELLASALAWQLQERKFGGLNGSHQRKLRVLARAQERGKRSELNCRRHRPIFAPGTVISKQWRGAEHVVTVLAEGYQHQGTVYGSLSPRGPRDNRHALERPGFLRPAQGARTPSGGAAMTASNAAIRWCAVYTRKSSEEGLEQQFNSLHAQREAAEAYIKSQRHEGWRLLAEEIR